MPTELSKLLHMINNKLTGISGFCQILQREVKSPKHKKQLSVIENLALEIAAAIEAYKTHESRTPPSSLQKMENLPPIEMQNSFERYA
jgi:nitrogen-specific signal transduction histidine kinase